MITLEFKDSLVNSRFSYYNEYNYRDLLSPGLYFRKSDNEVPFIMRGNSSTYSLHDVSGDLEEMRYSSFDRQLNGRILTTAKIKDVLDGSRCPLKIRIGSKTYLMGKGFLADFTNGSLVLLFVAVIGRAVTQPTIRDIRYYISRILYTPAHKKLQPVIKDFLAIFTGEVLITNDLRDYIGAKIPIPILKSISDRKVYNDKLINFCAAKIAEKQPKVEIKETKADVKKKKEKEILDTVRVEFGEVGPTAVVYTGAEIGL